MKRSQAMIARYGMGISDALIRRVWAEVTRTPQASCREIADTLGVHYSPVSVAIRFLCDCGYVEQEKRRARGRRIIVPFYTAAHRTEARE